MSTVKNGTNTLDKVIGFFVVREDDERAAAKAPRGGADAPAKGAPAPSTPRTPAAAAAPSTPPPAKEPARVLDAPVVPPGGAHDARAFSEIYRAAGVAQEEQDRVGRALELLRALPSSTPLDVRRSIVAASMTAFGIPVERIVETSNTLLRALDGYAADGEKRTSEVVAQGESRVARLEAEIAEVRRLVELQQQAQGELLRATAAEKAKVQALLDFFGAPQRVDAGR